MFANLDFSSNRHILLKKPISPLRRTNSFSSVHSSYKNREGGPLGSLGNRGRDQFDSLARRSPVPSHSPVVTRPSSAASHSRNTLGTIPAQPTVTSELRANYIRTKYFTPTAPASPFVPHSPAFVRPPVLFRSAANPKPASTVRVHLSHRPAKESLGPVALLPSKLYLTSDHRFDSLPPSAPREPARNYQPSVTRPRAHSEIDLTGQLTNLNSQIARRYTTESDTLSDTQSQMGNKMMCGLCGGMNQHRRDREEYESPLPMNERSSSGHGQHKTLHESLPRKPKPYSPDDYDAGARAGGMNTAFHQNPSAPAFPPNNYYGATSLPVTVPPNPHPPPNHPVAMTSSGFVGARGTAARNSERPFSASGSGSGSGGGAGAEDKTRALLNLSRTGGQSVPANMRRHRSELERTETNAAAALGGDDAALEMAKAESLRSAKPKIPSASAMPKSTDREAGQSADAGDTSGGTSGQGATNSGERSGSIGTNGNEPKKMKMSPPNTERELISLSTPPKPQVPALARDVDQFRKWTTLDEFGYEFKGNKLVQTGTDYPYLFDVKPGDQNFNQQYYDAFGEVMINEVQLQIDIEGLQRLPVPANPSPGQPQTFVFATPDFGKNANLLVLIHGAGAVRAGIWTRSLVINNGLDEGSQLPYIRRAKELGYAVLILNPNDNKRNNLQIPESSSPNQHCDYVFRTYVKPDLQQDGRRQGIRNIAIVAQGKGGLVATYLAHQLPEIFRTHVKAVAFSEAHYSRTDLPADIWDQLCRIAVDWITSTELAGTKLDMPINYIPKRSAGTTSHESTSYSAMADIFAFIIEKMGSATANKKAGESIVKREPLLTVSQRDGARANNGTTGPGVSSVPRSSTEASSSGSNPTNGPSERVRSGTTGPVVSSVPRSSTETSSPGTSVANRNEPQAMEPELTSLSTRPKSKGQPPALARDIDRFRNWRTFDEFGYEFKGNKLVQKGTDYPYLYDVKPGDRYFNQEYYEVFGEVAISEVQLLIDKEGLQRHPVPANPSPGQPHTFVFATQDFRENANLLVLIHGSGAVRAGIWARSLVINNGLNEGTHLPFIRQAKELGYAVLILNPNGNMRDHRPIPESSSPNHHCVYVFRTYVKPYLYQEGRRQGIRNIAIVAHSAGGMATTHLANVQPEIFVTHVKAVAFTDACYSRRDVAPDMWDHLCRIAIDWVASSQPVGTDLSMPANSVPKLSAGNSRHEWTSYSAMNSIFAFIKKKMGTTTSPRELPPAVYAADREVHIPPPPDGPLSLGPLPGESTGRPPTRSSTRKGSEVGMGSGARSMSPPHAPQGTSSANAGIRNDASPNGSTNKASAPLPPVPASPPIQSISASHTQQVAPSGASPESSPPYENHQFPPKKN